tara:strand:- start:4380 stop:4646 length:267 start_codon:yes stop_codon:yes gene_type:complete
MKKDKLMNGWWYEAFCSRNPNDNRLKRADDVINYYKFPKLCPDCEECWEVKSADIKNPYHYYKKGTLPTYGMEQKQCPKCKEKIGENK